MTVDICQYYIILVHRIDIQLLADKRIWLLAYAQASVHFSVAIFWILWAPTLVV